jgi:hypothetical protein
VSIGIESRQEIPFSAVRTGRPHPKTAPGFDTSKLLHARNDEYQNHRGRKGPPVNSDSFLP